MRSPFRRGVSMNQCRSYDVFDTCLLRNCAFPSDVFLLAANALAPLLENELGRDYAICFRDARVEAERLARLSAPGEEVTLEEIWLQVARLLPFIDVRAGIQAELDTERSCLTANGDMLREVVRLRAAGSRILFISDTYLPEAFVVENLSVHGFFADDDRCYVSSALRLTKRTGSLFRHVAVAEGIALSQLIHTGDHPVSDGVIPRRQGARAVSYRGGCLMEREQRVLSAQSDPNERFASRLAGRMRVFRLDRSEEHRASILSYVSSFLGPALFVFAHWVLTRAREHSIDRLYFSSRDCYATYRVAQLLSPLMGSIECKYLLISRQAVHLPSVEEISPTGMPWLFREFERPALSDVLSRLELDPVTCMPFFDEFVEHQERRWFVDTEERRRQFWQVLARPELQEIISETIRIRREAATAYFRSVGLFDSARSAVVDLGWFLTCQTALRRILRCEHPAHELQGFYLGLHRDRMMPCIAGTADAMFLSSPHDRVQVLGNGSVFKWITVLEHTLGCAPHGALLRYDSESDGSPKPLLAEADPDDQAVHAALVALVTRFVEPLVNDGLGELKPDHRALFSAILENSVAKPDGQWVEVLAGLSATDKPGAEIGSSLCRPYGLFEALSRPFASRVRGFPDGYARRWWHELALAGSTEGNRLIFNAYRALARARGAASRPARLTS
jgi:FMN phosphatase YigB (HAD superfamily)